MTKKKKKLEAKIEIGRDEKGKRIRKSIYASSERELNRKKTEFLMALAADEFNPNRTRFGEYSERWLETKEMSIETATYNMYNIMLNYLKDINHMLLKDIKKPTLQKIINDHKDKPATCKQINLTLKQIFENAIDDELINRNPARKLKLPKHEAKKKRALTPFEDILSDETNFNTKERLYVILLKYCGLRKSEALVLTRDDINIKKRTIDINKSLSHASGVAEVKSPKSKSGYRTVPIPKHILKELQKLIDQLPDILFSNEKHTGYITHKGFKTMWDSILKKMNAEATKRGYPEIVGLTSHVYRHNYTTLLHAAGVSPKEAQIVLGHANFNVTMDIYTHIDNSSEIVANRLDDFYRDNHALKTQKRTH